MSPCLRIEFLRSEHGNEILVAKFILCAVGCYVVFELWRTLHIHLSWIPFAAEGRHRICAPMNKDAELRVFIPIRYLVGLQGLPVSTVRAVVIDLVYLFQDSRALGVVFGTGLLPCLVDVRRVDGDGRSSGIRKSLAQCWERDQKRADQDWF